MQIASRRRSLLLMMSVAALGVGCDDAAPGGGVASPPAATLTLDASAVPADFKTHRHSSEDLSIRAPADWRYMEQPFRRQNDVLVGLFPPGAVPADDGPVRLYVHGHVLPTGVTFDQFVSGHESGSFARAAGQTFLSSEPAQLNGLAAHRWSSAGQPQNGIKTKRLMFAAAKGQTVYYAEFRSPPETYDELAPVVVQIVSSLTIGEPTPWPSPPPPPLPRQSQE